MTSINKYRYEKRYTADNIKEVLYKYPNGLMLKKLMSEIGCSEMTARNLLKPLIESGEIVKHNMGLSDTKPYYLYMLKKE